MTLPRMVWVRVAANTQGKTLQQHVEDKEPGVSDIDNLWRSLAVQKRQSEHWQ